MSRVDKRTSDVVYITLIIGIVLLAAYLRLSSLDVVEFKSDEAAVAGMARWYIENLQLPLVGLKSSVGVFNGPAFIYLMSIPLALSRNPVLATGFVALLNVLAVLYGFKFARDYFGGRTALLSSLLFATSPWAVTFSRKIWSQDALPLFTILFFASLFSVAIRGRGRQIALAFLWLSVLIQLHLAPVAFAPLLILVLVFYRRKINLKYIFLGVALFLASFAPYLYWELTNDFQNIRTVMRIGGQQSMLDLEPAKLAFELIGSPGYAALTFPSYPQFMEKVSHLTWTNTLEGWIFVVSLIYLFLKAAASARSGGWRSATKYNLLLLWFVLPVVFYIRRSYDMQLHYLIVLFPMPFMAMGLLFSDVIEWVSRSKASIDSSAGDRDVLKMVGLGGVIAVVALIAGAQVLLFNSFIGFIQKEDVQAGYGIPLKYQMEAANLLKQKLAQDKEAAAFVVYHQSTYALSLDYLLDYRKNLKHLDDRGALAFSPSASANYYLVMDSDGPAAKLLSAQSEAHLIDKVELPGKAQPFQLFKVGADAGFSLANGVAFKPLEVSFDNGVRLRGYSVDKKALPGGIVNLMLHWKVEGSPKAREADFAIFAHLLDNDGHQLGGEDSSGYPSSEWQSGDEFITWHKVPVAKEAKRGQYWIEVGMYDRGTLSRPALYDKEGKRIGGSVKVGPVKIAAPSTGVSDEASPSHLLETRLGDGIILQGYDLKMDKAQPGDVLRLTLYWRALRDIDQDYVVFTHLLDSNGKLLSQQDSRPVKGTYPTALWEKDEVVKDEYQLQVPVGASPGRYQIEVGMYTWPNLKRLEVYGSSGQSIGDRILIK